VYNIQYTFDNFFPNVIFTLFLLEQFVALMMQSYGLRLFFCFTTGTDAVSFGARRHAK